MNESVLLLVDNIHDMHDILEKFNVNNEDYYEEQISDNYNYKDLRETYEDILKEDSLNEDEYSFKDFVYDEYNLIYDEKRAKNEVIEKLPVYGILEHYSMGGMFDLCLCMNEIDSNTNISKPYNNMFTHYDDIYCGNIVQLKNLNYEETIIKIQDKYNQSITKINVQKESDLNWLEYEVFNCQEMNNISYIIDENEDIHYVSRKTIYEVFNYLKNKNQDLYAIILDIYN